MPKFEQVKFLPYKPEDLFKMVMDVESYPKFLPWCQASRIISRSEEGIVAELVIKFKSITENYSSLITNEIDANSYSIKVISISGIFKKLDNTWRIEGSEYGSKLKFTIDIEFKSKIYNSLIQMFFPSACSKMMQAFEKRANDLFEISL